MTSKKTATVCGRCPAAFGRTPFRAALRLMLATGLLGWGAQAAAQAATVSVGDASAAEGSAGTTTLAVPVSRSGSTAGVIGMVYETAVDPAATAKATAGIDHAAVIRGIATIADGAASSTLPVSITGDTEVEPDESFLMRLLSATNAGPIPSFGTAAMFNSGSNPRASAAADFNGDGRPDIAIADQSDGVRIYLNTTTPGSSTAGFALAGGVSVLFPSSIAVADLNGDGRVDLVVGSANDDRLSIWLNTTSPGEGVVNFSACCSIASGGRTPLGVVVADFNGDGRRDLATANNNSSTISVFLNNSSPGAAAPSFTSPLVLPGSPAPRAIAAADINGDGKPDLVTANQTGGSLSVFRNTTASGGTTASFGAAIDLPVDQFTTSNTFALAVGDVNGDGRVDLVATNINRANVVVRLNTTVAGSGTIQFSPFVAFDTAGNARSVALRDVNGDGRPDLIAGNRDGNSLAVLHNLTAPGQASPVFSVAVTYASGTRPEALAVADFNGDGLPDAVLAAVGQVSVFSNSTVLPAPAAKFSAASSFGGGAAPRSVAVGDLNSDGRPDVAVANGDGNSVSVFLNGTVPGATAATFSSEVDFGTGAGPFSVAIGDINGDGRPDLAVANYFSGNVSVLLNSTAPGAVTANFSSGGVFSTNGAAISVSIGDINGDGRPDLAMAIANGNWVAVLLNTTVSGATSTSFSAPITFATGAFPYSVAMDDLNGDGRPDLAVANADSSSVSVLLNTTVPGAVVASFATRSDFPAGGQPWSVAIDDLNGDGRPDLAVANRADNSVSVLLNGTAPGATTSSFASAANFGTGPGPWSIAIGDLNGDGRPDLVTANNSSNTVSVLLNSTDPGVAVASFASAAGFVAGLTLISVDIGDLNGDGRPDLAVANRFGPSASVLLNRLYEANIGTGEARATIVNDDVQTLSINDVTVTEGNSGTTAATFTVTLSQASPNPVTVSRATVDGTATAGGDYVGLGTALLSFAPGETSKTLTVQVLGDTRFETDETFGIVLSGVSGATIARGTGTGTIVNDDAQPTASFETAGLTVGEAAGGVAVTVSLSNASDQSIELPFSVSGAAGTGDLAVSASPLGFAPGETSKTVTVTVIDDAIDEDDETVGLSLGTPVNAALGSATTYTLTIQDNDDAPTLRFENAVAGIGEGTGSVTSRVLLSAASGRTVTVPVTLALGSASAADLSLTSGGTISIAPGATFAEVTVALVDDALDEADETASLNLGMPTHATLAVPFSQSLTIVDNDAPPTVSLSVSPASIGEAGGMATVTATLSAASGQPVIVNLGYGGAAGAGDYGVSGSSIAIPAGTTGGSVTITATQDAIDEADETVVASIASASNATAGSPASITVTLVDDDAPPSLRFSLAAQSVAEAGGAVTLTVQLSAASGLPVTVPVGIGGGTATAADRGNLSATTLSFTPGSTSASLSLPIISDALFEPTETVIISLGAPVNATMGSPASQTVSIVDDDAEAVASLTLTPASASRQTLETHCLTAVARDIGGTPLPSLTIGFARTGANAGGGSAATDAGGSAQHCWTGANGGTDRVRASFGGVTSGEATIAWTRRSTAIDADGVITVQISGPIRVQLAPRAVLSSGGAPLAGRSVKFRTGIRPICTAVTDAAGVARCTATLTGTVNGVVRNGFVADFDGDAAYLAATDKGAIVEVK